MIPILNLLPPENKREINRAKILLLWHEILLLLFIMVSIGSALLYFAQNTLEKRFQEATLTPTAGSSQMTMLNRTVRNINQVLAPLNRVATSSRYFSPLLQALVNQTPPSIAWTALTVDAPGTATLRGTAATRRDLATFKANLESAPQFTRVNLPLQYLLGIGQIEFAMELFFDPIWLNRPLQ